jgi:two-component system OmpR family sensor kinase
MWATVSSRPEGWVAPAWAAFATLNIVLMWAFPGLETVPFHLAWISLALAYGLTQWTLSVTFTVCAVLTVATGMPLAQRAHSGVIAIEEISEIPLMALLFLVMVVHVRRRSAALTEAHLAADRERVARDIQKRFVRLASHELRTPITVARGYTELLDEDFHDHHVREDLRVVLDELDKLERIADRLLALALANQVFELDTEVVDMAVLMRRVARRWEPVARRPVYVEVAPVRVQGDEERLETALDCLLDNALLHGEGGSVLFLRVYQDGVWTVIEVEDDGPGITAERRAALLGGRDLPPESPRGSGLGLTIVRAVVHAHGGRFALNTPPSGGLCATLRLPTALAETPPGSPPG